MAASKAQQRATNKWMAANYDRVNLTLPKGQKEIVQAHAAAHSQSVNGFIGRAINETMERDGAGSQQEGREGTSGAGMVSLPSDTLEAAQRAAERTGEAPVEFMARAIETQARRDRSSFALGIDPVTGDKLNQTGKGGADHEQ